MARMYSRRKGVAGSKKPIRKAKPSWVRYEAKEVEQLVLKLARQGYSSSLVGMHLRDTYGVPDVRLAAGKNIKTILKENKMSPKLPDDLRDLIRRNVELMKHLEANKKDETAKRGLMITESKIKRLARYYKEEGMLPGDWFFVRDKAKLLLE
ncbi:MAG: 30S ribosomal protein S15 [Nanoarchaeota archaeon]|mgnify:CR=1 FL=1